MKQHKKQEAPGLPDLPRALQKWEYKVMLFTADLERHLDELGEKGWELVAIEQREITREGAAPPATWTVFKRPVY
ncbi:MAG: DUF4177 domain-containing protein [Candidatus Eremiobacteraeota bacterium]|nr:DUF4177 domain-containing protein [Candidatus Eremiobacteraeota bacterium]